VASQLRNETIMVLSAGAGPHSVEALIVGMIDKRGA
jgi:hypothetical protein